jgi:hypothetical protein
MADRFPANTTNGLSLTSPGTRARAITPHNDNDLDIITRGLYVGVSGDIAAILADDTDSVIFTAVPVGFFPWRCKRILATGTTATNMVGVD